MAPRCRKTLSPYLAPALWLVAMAICAWWAWARTPVANDLTLFIPRSDDQAALLLGELQRGPATRLLLIGLEGGAVEARAATSERLAQRLRATGFFVRVANGTTSADPDSWQALFAHRYLLSPTVTPERFSVEGLRTALRHRLRELATPFSALEKRLLPDDPTAELRSLLDVWRGAGREPRQRHGVWFSANERYAVLLAETRSPAYDLAAQDRVLDAVREAFAAARADPAVRLQMSGPAVIATRSRDVIRFQVQWLTLAATTMVVAVLWWVYRSWWPVLLGILPLASALVAATAAVGLVFGEIYAITLGFGITLLGVAIDYPVHLFSHLSAREAARTTLNRIWPTLRLGALTTAAGYLAMLAWNFTGLAQLGVFAIAGLLTAVAFVRWVMPVLLPETAPTSRPLGAWMDRLLQPSRTVGIAAGTLGVAAVLTVAVATPPTWEDDLAALSPIPAGVLALDRELRHALGAPDPVYTVVVTAADAETALRRSEKVINSLRLQVERGLLGGFEAAARYLPSRETQHQRQQALPDRERLQQALDQALSGLPFKPGLFDPFVEAVAEAQSASLLVPEDLGDTALGLRVSSLLFPTGQGWVAPIPLSEVRNPEELAASLVQAHPEGVYLLDVKAQTNRLVAGFREAALDRLWGGAVLIGAVLWIGLKSWRRVLAVLLPVGLAVALDVAVLAGLGQGLSLFHLVSLLLVLGIGIDYSLFFSRPEREPETRRRILHAVLVCSGSTLAVFGMLSLSTVPVLGAIGQTVAIGVLLSLVSSLLLAQQIHR